MSVRRKSLLTLFVVPLVIVLSLVGLGVANAARSGHPAVQPKLTVPTITISSFTFHSPASVRHGALIKVINKDGVGHTVTSDTRGKFNVSVPAHSSRTFHAPGSKGTYRFHCTPHPTMHGVLHVN